ncbi:MAG: YggS family pyridoxal phosphate-dependent enzyme [Planctomycetaceae bacterium]|nr:YggS family pyridoxal phosphate-dependent enzyme [Planctomycetaceae bacterium]
MPALADLIRRNLDRIEQQIENACLRVDRNTSSVQLVAVTKYADWPWVEALLELGYNHLGENRPQQLEERSEKTTIPIHWHLIGQLQRNKIRKVLPFVSLIHSIDSMKLLAAVDRIAQEEQLQPNVLLQINVSGEASKQGFAPAELREQWAQIENFSQVNIVGLMTMAPHVDDPELARPAFRKLRDLKDELNQISSQIHLRELSMGMSNDFEIAIEEGATLIRIGSSLFEGLE